MKLLWLIAAISMVFAGLVYPLSAQAEDVTDLFPTWFEISPPSPGRGPWYRFEVVEDGTQTIAEVAAWLDGDDAASRLLAWGWQGNAYRV